MATDDEPVAKRTRRAQANDSEDGSEDDGSEDDGGDESEDSSARTRLRVERASGGDARGRLQAVLGERTARPLI